MLQTKNIHDYYPVICKFIQHIDSVGIISNFINDCGGYNSELEEDIEKLCQDTSYNLTLSGSDEDEVTTVYTLLKFITVHYKSFPLSLILMYSSSSAYADKIQEFNNRIVRVLIGHIENYLKEVGIKMGLDNNNTYNINGNQVVVANDNATVTAVQNNNGINANELHKLIEAMKSELNTELSPEDKADAEESIDIIETELESGNPDQQKIRSQFKLLSRIDSGVKFASAVASLLTFADKVFPFLADVAPFYLNLLK